MGKLTGKEKSNPMQEREEGSSEMAETNKIAKLRTSRAIPYSNQGKKAARKKKIIITRRLKQNLSEINKRNTARKRFQ